jgi:hypothetical protein
MARMTEVSTVIVEAVAGVRGDASDGAGWQVRNRSGAVSVTPAARRARTAVQFHGIQAAESRAGAVARRSSATR